MATWKNAVVEVHVVDEDSTPPKFKKLRADFRNYSYQGANSYQCAICGGDAISVGYVHRIFGSNTDNGMAKLIHDFETGVRCFSCKRALALSLEFPSRLPYPPNIHYYWAKQGPSVIIPEFWYEWQGQLYQRGPDYKCPICDEPFKHSEAQCTHCGAQIVDHKKIFVTLYNNWSNNMGRGWKTDAQGRWYAKVTMTWNPTIGAYKVTFQYANKDLIDIIKAMVPSSDRSYDPKTMVWTFTENHFDMLKLLFEHKYTTVEVYEKAKIEAEYAKFENNFKVVDPKTQLGTFVKLVNDAGINIPADINDGKLARKAYLRAAMFYHPDRNPDRAKDMSSLNEAWSNLQEYFGLKGVTT